MISAKCFSLALLFTPLAWTTNLQGAKANPPVPGTVTTTASPLTAENNPSEDTVAQVERRRTQRTVRRGPFSPNYLGIGINLGFDGNTSLSEVEFAVLGRLKLTPNLSFRPSAIIGENAVILVPVTYDFLRTDVDVAERTLVFTPYVGGGILFTTDEDSEDDLGALITAGIDVPVSRDFTANAGLNVGFVNDDVEIGLLLGVGYNIPSN